ncbi:MAG: transcription-repair coupling factor [Rhodothermaceae bacterium]|nr:transcription-repair coupling factor [Rhodothermaceae bacterium]
MCCASRFPVPAVSLDALRQRLAGLPFFGRVRDEAAALEPSHALRLKGTVGSIPAFVLADLLEQHGGPLVALLAESESADYLRSDLEQVLGTDDHVLFFPPTGHVPYDPEQLQESAPLVARADALAQLREGFEGILVTSVEAIGELVPPPETVSHETMTIRIGDDLPPEDLMARVTGQGFEPVEFVESPGEVALRGGILDLFPFAGGYPVRIEFFGDEIDSIRAFDPQSQRSVTRMESARLVPNLDAPTYTEDGHVTALDFLPEHTITAVFDAARLVELADQRYAEATEHFTERHADHPEEPLPSPVTRYLDGDGLRRLLSQRPRLLFGIFAGDADQTLELAARPQPAYNGDIARFREVLAARMARGEDSLLLCDSRSQRDRLFELLGGDADLGKAPAATLLVESLHEGFEVPAARLAVYTDHQLFNRYHRPTARKRKRAKSGLTLRDLQALTPGDFVVHIDHGIGKFAGLNKITVREQQQEAVRLLFAGGDELFVNVGALHKLHKYTGKEGHQPKLTRLGTGAWERLKARTKKRVKDIARDLIKLYAQRKAAEGYQFKPDSLWQRELEAAFPYEDTPDQVTATAAVKEDMEQAIPMDRLVCGDVGFGKTEIAVRAAFKAVQDGKQVAVIVPTTILAAQHVETFTKRMGRYPVRLAQLSRFVSKEEQKEVIAGLAEGTVDVVIGTHRLLSKDVQFKDLGLLIVDEEQRFGVSAKEKLRKLRPNVDTLTLTATPIPRTLQFSLLGARDLSIMNTPPANRQPVVTEIHTFGTDLIRDAILYEVNRGGQVFFLHNRVQSIDGMAATIQSLVPDVRIRVAHGQMPSAQLEAVMHDFMDRKFDVLVSTNIIESGLDVANANTILINHAERHGLSDLHQLRGRVGRSDQKAFCYLLVPSVHALTREARQRLQAVEEFAELGSGFNIAMRDLDIRGAGNMLGAEQSGFIEDVGFETYHKILDEAVQELRAEEFAEVFAESGHIPPAREPAVDVEEDVFIPADYVTNAVERLNLYRRLAELPADEIDAFRAELEDRFGPIPEAVETLLLMSELKPLAHALRLSRVTWKNQRLFLTVPTQADDPYFYQHVFEPLLARLDVLPNRYVLKDSKAGRLRAIVQDVATLRDATTVLDRLQLSESEPVAS